MRFLKKILPKLYLSPPRGVKCNSLVYLLAIVTTEFLQLWWPSQVEGLGFEPGLVLELLFVSPPVGRGFELFLRHTFFALSVSRNISRCLAGVLFHHLRLCLLFLSINPLSSIICEFNQKIFCRIIL